MNTAITDPFTLELWEAIRDGKEFEKRFISVSRLGGKEVETWLPATREEVAAFILSKELFCPYRIKPEPKPEPKFCWVAFGQTSGCIITAFSEEEKASVEEAFYITSSGWHKVEDK